MHGFRNQLNCVPKEDKNWSDKGQSDRGQGRQTADGDLGRQMRVLSAKKAQQKVPKISFLKND